MGTNPGVPIGKRIHLQRGCPRALRRLSRHRQPDIVGAGAGREAGSMPDWRALGIPDGTMRQGATIAMTTELESEVSELCNLSQWVYNEGLSKGIEGAVELLREAGIEDPVIIERIMDQYHLTLEAAQKYVLHPADSEL